MNNTESVSKKIYFKDVIKGKSFEELMQLIPCMVCIEEEYSNEMHYDSYEVLGFGPDYVILGYTTTEYDEDAFFGDGSYTSYHYQCVDFKDLDESYIFAHKPTEKQIECLKKYHKYDECMSGYEAWHLISEIIAENKARYEERQKQKEHNTYDYDYDDDYPYDYPYDCYDIPNM